MFDKESCRHHLPLWGAFIASLLFLFVPGVKDTALVLWPSLVAIGLTFLTHNIWLALFFGAFCGSILVHQEPLTAFLKLFSDYMLPALADPWNAGVLVFTLMMGGFVELLNRGGGMQTLAERWLKNSQSTKRTELGIFALGWVMFIDGLANAMLVGRTMRPIADRAGVSRERLALIVDTTSSPIAAFALVSTWIAFEMSVIREGFVLAWSEAEAAGISPFSLLIQSLPHRYYNYVVLALVFASIVMGKHLRPLRKLETVSTHPEKETAAESSGNTPAWRALAPVAFLLIAVFMGLFLEGRQPGDSMDLQGIIAAFGRSNASMVFVCATALASVFAMIIFPRHAKTKKSTSEIYIEGMQKMFPPVVILALAWTLSGVIKDLETGQWLSEQLAGNMAPGLLPVSVFILAALTSFSTGTSWGTMAILMPLVIPIGIETMQVTPGAEIPSLLIATIGAVLSGAVFGDHCSPISDTTLVSAISSGCGPIRHVHSQLPYALWAGGVSIVIWGGCVAVGIPTIISLILIPAMVWGIIRFKGG